MSANPPKKFVYFVTPKAYRHLGVPTHPPYVSVEIPDPTLQTAIGAIRYRVNRLPVGPYTFIVTSVELRGNTPDMSTMQQVGGHYLVGGDLFKAIQPLEHDFSTTYRLKGSFPLPGGRLIYYNVPVFKGDIYLETLMSTPVYF